MNGLAATTALTDALLATLGVSAAFTLLLLLKSTLHYTRGGPRLREEILAHYFGYTLRSVLRLALHALLLASLLAWPGALLHAALVSGGLLPPSLPMTVLAALLSLGTLAGLQFLRHLLYLPSSLLMSWQYRYQRLYGLWHLLSPVRLRLLAVLVALAWLVPFLAALGGMIRSGRLAEALLLFAAAALPATMAWAGGRRPGAAPLPPATDADPAPDRPNLLLIGADTLRADRLGGEGYRRALTPTLDRLAARSLRLSNCYVPLGRTAASLASLFTGTWPVTHGIRDNFVADDETGLPDTALPRLLGQHGYRSLAIADWSGADLGKLDFGFDVTDTPEDQWNIRYYIRQGPMDLRLFLSLFTHNRYGRRFLPELYFLAGVPLTRHLGHRTRETLSRLARSGQPFMLNLFMGTTHVPFGSEYPWYQRYADPDYAGESKFVMTTLRDPNEIIAKQEAPESCFDVEQILNLYDGCVRAFDDEVNAILRHLRNTGLADNTLVVIYSDHGVDFFENETWGQGNTILGDDPGARVPLIIHDPRHPEGKVIEGITRSVDLLPTLLELLEIPAPPGLEGVSLLPAWRGGPLPDLPAFQETGIWLGQVPGRHPDHLDYPNLLELLDVPDPRTGTLSIKAEYRERVMRAKDTMIRRGRWKLVCLPLASGDCFRLYDLETDPHCRRDIAPEHPELVESLRAELLSWRKGGRHST
ncbi:sulfatase family protein [Thiohalobacter sp.]|uniref:sulfatase family protein n=1 Tax=Thiohalobacter sp. TaxID=2025948 RepID=UPI002606D71B|nr:sulfatase-like hydrolase/transferase [Thiohalobacter sp.]